MPSEFCPPASILPSEILPTAILAAVPSAHRRSLSPKSPPTFPFPQIPPALSLSHSHSRCFITPPTPHTLFLPSSLHSLANSLTSHHLPNTYRHPPCPSFESPDLPSPCPSPAALSFFSPSPSLPHSRNSSSPPLISPPHASPSLPPSLLALLTGALKVTVGAIARTGRLSLWLTLCPSKLPVSTDGGSVTVCVFLSLHLSVTVCISPRVSLGMCGRVSPC